jgi:hypothetical protein
MQRLITSFLIVAFAGLSVFGIVFMVHQGDVTHDGCLAGTPFNTACPQSMGAFSMIDLHFEALGLFSSATFSELSAVAGLAFLGVLLAGLLGSDMGVLSQAAVVVMQRRQFFDLAHSAFHRRIADWLVLHSKRDIAFAVRF